MGLIFSNRGRRGLVFLHATLLFIVIIKITILAFALGVDEAIGMRASIGVAVPSVFVVTVIAHTLCVMFLIFVRALDHLHGLSLGEASHFF